MSNKQRVINAIDEILSIGEKDSYFSPTLELLSDVTKINDYNEIVMYLVELVLSGDYEYLFSDSQKKFYIKRK